LAYGPVQTRLYRTLVLTQGLGADRLRTLLIVTRRRRTRAGVRHSGIEAQIPHAADMRTRGCAGRCRCHRSIDIEGKIVEGTQANIVRVGVGVRAPVPDIGGVEAFKNAMLVVRSIAYLKEGNTGLYLAKLFEKLGDRRSTKADDDVANTRCRQRAAREKRSGGTRAIVPSSFMISQITPAAYNPASLARSTAASVWPRRSGTPPGQARSGKTCSGLAKSSASLVASMAALLSFTHHEPIGSCD
jgi:hypothetical protein